MSWPRFLALNEPLHPCPPGRQPWHNIKLGVFTQPGPGEDNAAKGRILKKLAGIKIVKNRAVLSQIDSGKPQKGTYEAFKYAPLEEIDKHLRPLLAAEEMDLSYSDEPCEGSILIRGRLKHLPSGHYEDSFMPAPPDTTGGKSNVQAVGSTNSFLRRYVACNIF